MSDTVVDEVNVPAPECVSAPAPEPVPVVSAHEPEPQDGEREPTDKERIANLERLIGELSSKVAALTWFNDEMLAHQNRLTQTRHLLDDPQTRGLLLQNMAPNAPARG